MCPEGAALQGAHDHREQKEVSKEPELFVSLVLVPRVQVKKPSTQLRPASKDVGDSLQTGLLSPLASQRGENKT